MMMMMMMMMIIISVYYVTQVAHRIHTQHSKIMKHKKTKTTKTKNELYAGNMSMSHLSPYVYYSVLCSDRILMPVLISQNCTLCLHANVRNIKLSEYTNLF